MLLTRWAFFDFIIEYLVKYEPHEQHMRAQFIRFKMRWILRMILFYFVMFFLCVDKLKTETTTARLKHWIKQQISVGLTKRFGNIKEKWEQNESIYSILVVFCLFVVLWIFVLIKNARSTLTHSARTEIWSCDLCICEVIEWFFVHSTLLLLFFFLYLCMRSIDCLWMLFRCWYEIETKEPMNKTQRNMYIKSDQKFKLNHFLKWVLVFFLFRILFFYRKTIGTLNLLNVWKIEDFCFIFLCRRQWRWRWRRRRWQQTNDDEYANDVSNAFYKLLSCLFFTVDNTYFKFPCHI